MKLSEYTPKRASIIYKLNRPETESHINVQALWFDIVRPEDVADRVCLDTHTHSFYEVFMMFGGSSINECNGEIIELKTGDALFLPPNTPHKHISHTEDFLKVSFAFALVEDASPHIVLGNEPKLFSIPSDVAPNINYVLAHSENKDIFVPKIICGRILEIVYSICKALTAKLPQTDELDSDPRVIVAKQFIYNNKHKIITTDDVAKECCLCAKQLGRIFKKETGCTVYEYIIATRVKHARQLLLQKQYTIKEISYMLGFENESSFVSFFRRHYGTPPGVFRRNNLDI